MSDAGTQAAGMRSQGASITCIFTGGTDFWALLPSAGSSPLDNSAHQTYIKH